MWNIPFEEIANGALILLLLRESNTWEELCGRYARANPAHLRTNIHTVALLKKLFEMRDVGLIRFEDEETRDGKKPVGIIREFSLCTMIRAAFGVSSLTDVAILSRNSQGMAVAPVFRRPRQLEEEIDIFVLMPFHTTMEKVYINHIKKMQIPPDLVVKWQAIDIANVILSLIWRRYLVHAEGRNRKSRCEALSPSAAHRFTT